MNPASYNIRQETSTIIICGCRRNHNTSFNTITHNVSKYGKYSKFQIMVSYFRGTLLTWIVWLFEGLRYRTI